MFDQQPDRDAKLDAAHRTVALARARLDHVRRQFMARECGRTDVAIAEAQLSQALDKLDHAAGRGWRV